MILFKEETLQPGEHDNITVSRFPPRREAKQSKHNGAATEDSSPKQVIQSSAGFVSGFVPPDYLIDGLLQRRFLYSLTGRTGGGKTAISLLVSASVALGRPISSYTVQPGRVLYLAGENPDDIRMR